MITIGRNALYYEDYALSIQYFNQAIQAKPYLYEPYFYRAVAKYYLGDYHGAIEDCSESIERDPFIDDCYRLRAINYVMTAQYGRALQDYRHLIAMQIDDKAPQVIKDALDNREISINQGYNITRQLQELPEEEREQAAEIAVAEEKMKKELRKSDAELDRRAKIAGTFCKAFEKSFDLRPTEENIGCWVNCCRMRTREIKHAIDEARELSQMYASIEQTLRKLYPEAAKALDEEDWSIAEAARDARRENSADG